MHDEHDPNGALKQKVIQINGPKSLPVSKRIKQLAIGTAVAVVISIISLALGGALSWLSVLSMPLAFGLLVYAAYLRYKDVLDQENKPPDWSKIEVPKVLPVEPRAKQPEEHVIFSGDKN